MARLLAVLDLAFAAVLAAAFPAMVAAAPPAALAVDPAATRDGPGDPAPYTLVLGIAQDGGVPQAGTRDDPAWSDPTLVRRVVCLAIVDPGTGARWMIECTPDFPRQLHAIDRAAPPRAGAGPPGLDGIFLTHAHMGHYTGLMFLGHEAMGARGVPVHVMPRLGTYLETNGPWSQLVALGNIVLRPLADGEPVRLNERITVTPFLVPHRQEFSEVVGFRIEGPERTVLFLPDIDRWEAWETWGEEGTGAPETKGAEGASEEAGARPVAGRRSDRGGTGKRIEEVLRGVDVAYLDGTFYANGEIPGRDMSTFPHPFITTTMERLAGLPAAERAKVRFLHLNHTNPALDPDGEARASIEARGFRVAEEGERVGL